MSADALSVAHRFTRAFNSRDVDRVLKVFTPDAVYHDLFYGRFDGHAGLRRLLEVFETRAGRCHTYREYFDRTAVLLAVGIAPAAVARIAAQRPSVQLSLLEQSPLSR
ncbi:nuclear transport factor 2 family protein [Geodermatophilus sp. TF02-6]|uniref:YybH family protein n=1 Tax=Geodermatophilus sp. TF02-6 TaxID=2250575 RepID=UPI0011BE059B|nr:nuclear transport factor 2 family protein [Geodermatophilus sp. TF02-6]